MRRSTPLLCQIEQPPSPLCFGGPREVTPTGREQAESTEGHTFHLCSLVFALLFHDLDVLDGRWVYGFNDLMLSPPFIEILTMFFPSRFIFMRSTIRIWLFS